MRESGASHMHVYGTMARYAGLLRTALVDEVVVAVIDAVVVAVTEAV